MWCDQRRRHLAGQRFQVLADCCEVGSAVRLAPPLGADRQVREAQHDHAEPVQGDLFGASGVVDAPLLRASYPAKSLSAVEEGRWFVVLGLVDLDDEVVVGPVGVDPQPCAVAVCIGIAEQPAEGVLTAPGRAEDLVAQVEHIRRATRLDGLNAGIWFWRGHGAD